MAFDWRVSAAGILFFPVQTRRRTAENIQARLKSVRPAAPRRFTRKPFVLRYLFLFKHLLLESILILCFLQQHGYQSSIPNRSSIPCQLLKLFKCFGITLTVEGISMLFKESQRWNAQSPISSRPSESSTTSNRSQPQNAL